MTTETSLIKKQSEIHGKGIFASESIEKGQVFYNVPATFIYKNPASRHAYAGNGKYVCDEQVLNYVNHSCNPNSMFDSANLSLISLRDIPQGEEITVDYSLTEKNGSKVVCNCKSENCKGFFLRIERPIIGILGGIGPESSSEFYRRLIEKMQEKGVMSNTDYPHILINSIPAPELIFENPDISMYKEGLEYLEIAGVNFIVISCNTAYIFLEKLKEDLNIPVIDLRGEMQRHIEEKNIKSVSILGSQHTSRNLLNSKNIKIIGVSNIDSEKLNELILNYNVGKEKQESKEKLSYLIKKYAKESEAVVIACTELSTIAKESSLNFIDTMDILVQATINKYASLQNEAGGEIK